MSHNISHTVATSTCHCYKVAWEHPVWGPTFGARLMWYRYAKNIQKPFDYIIRVHIHVFLHAIATKLPGSTPFGARSSGPVVRGPTFGARRSGPDSCGTGMPKTSKHHVITSSEFTYMCFYMPLLQSCLGAPRSGPDVRGPTLVA